MYFTPLNEMDFKYLFVIGTKFWLFTFIVWVGLFVITSSVTVFFIKIYLKAFGIYFIGMYVYSPNFTYFKLSLFVGVIVFEEIIC